MEIRLLGPVEVECGEPVSLGGPTPRRLLVILALHRNGIVSIDQLIDVTWPDGRRTRADRNIRSYVHRLRTALGAESDRIETVDTGYRLHVEANEVDIDRFDELCRRVAARALTEPGVDALGWVDQAEELWRGPPFGEFADEPWARSEVARLCEAHHLLREYKADLLLANGAAVDAVTVLEQLIAEQPLRERPRMLHMRALQSSGRHVDALRSFQTYRRLLVEEVGVEPSEKIVDLDRAIAQGAAPAVGERDLVGAYSLGERIGHGAYGVVHRGLQRSLGRQVAVKIIRAELANRPDFIRRFETEAKLVARVEHPRVVPLYDFWRDPDRAYLVMRYMAGGSLAQRIDEGPCSIDDTLSIVDDVAAALDAAHTAGVVHRDVKPANVLFDADGNAFLGDFGIALDLTVDSDDRGSAILLSSPFTSPEQLRGELLSPSTDVYGLAMVAYTSLCGTAPFSDSVTTAQLLRRVLDEPLPDLGAGGSGLPTAVDEVLRIAAAKEPGARYVKASDFARALRSAAQAPAIAALPAHDAPTTPNPYRGLRAFEEADAGRFHGRQHLIEELCSALREPERRLLALVGPSGSGKSSVVRAGLLPALRAGAAPGSARWFITSMTPGNRPFEALETALLRVAFNPPTELVDQLRAGPRGILRACRRILPDDDTMLLVVIDQFEELFTSERSSDDSDHFLEAVSVAVSEHGAPIRIVATLRADFYDRPLRHPQFAPLMKAATIAVTPLAADELEEVIVRPAESVGASYEPGLVTRIMSDVAGQPGSLPLLQYALTQTFDRSDRRLIRRSDYDAAGGMARAVAQRAEELHAAVDLDQQAAIRSVFGRLVALGEGTEDTRRRAHRSELGSSQAVNDTLERYGAARLVSFDVDPTTREPTVEVAHEALITQWPRLREWLDTDRDGLRLLRHLSTSAREWDAAGRPESELYRGGRLEAADAWAADHDEDLRPLEQQFLRAGVELRMAEQAAEHERFALQVQTNRRLRRLLAGVGMLLAFALIAGTVAFDQRSNARTAAYDAETGRLVATAQSLASTNPRAAMLLAVAAYQREQGPSTLGALQATLSTAGPLIGHLGWGTEYIDVEWLVNDRIVAAREDGLELFDASTGALLDSLMLDIGRGPVTPWTQKARMTSASEVPVIAVASTAPAVLVLDVGDQLSIRLERTFDDPIGSIAINPDASVFVASDMTNTITGWDESGDRFETDLEEAQNFFEQGAPVLGDDFLYGFMFADIPVYTHLQAFGDFVLVGTGAYVRQLNWEGDTLRGPTYLTRVEPPGELIPVGMVGATMESDRLAVFGTNTVHRLALDRDWPALETGDPVVGLLGGGSPNIVATVADPAGGIQATLTDGSVTSVDPTTGQQSRTIDVGLSSISAASSSPNAKRVAVAHPLGIAMLSSGGGNPLTDEVPRPELASNLSISRGGRFVVLGPPGTVGPIRVLERDSDSGWVPLEGLPSEGVFAQVPAAEPGDPIFMTTPSEGGGQQQIFLLETGRPEFFAAEIGERAASAGDLSPNLLIYAIGSLVVDLVAPPEFQAIGELPLPPGDSERFGPTGVRFDPTGEWLLVSNELGRSQLWETATWTLVEIDALNAADIAVGYWNGDGSLLATASSSGRISIRDGRTFSVIRTMTGAVGTSNTWNDGALLFSDDDSLLLTNFDGSGQLWDVASGQQIGIDFSTAQGTNSGSNVGDILQLVTASEASALIWNLDIDTWPTIACTSAGSNLTADEWAQWGPVDERYRAICNQFPLPPD